MSATRTTLSIDDDVLAYARQVANDRGRPLGEVISELAREGMSPYGRQAIRNGIQLLPVKPDSKRATLLHVNTLRDDLP